MKRHLTSVALTGALAFSGIGAAPPPAQAGDLGDHLAGAAAVAILGAAIASHSDHGGEHGGGSHHGREHTAHGGHGGHGGGYGKSGHGALPAECRVHSGRRHGYSGYCLSRSYTGYAELPSACEIRVGGRHGAIYRDSCLDRYGYSTGYR